MRPWCLAWAVRLTVGKKNDENFCAFAAAGGCVEGGIEPPSPQRPQENTACALLALGCGRELGLSGLHKITTAIGFLGAGCRDGR